MNLPKFAVEHKALVLAGLILALLWSVDSAVEMQRREDPGTVQRQTEIVTLFPGASTSNVEELVTKKVADDARGVAHVLHVEGSSRPGISVIDVTFDDTIDSADGVLRDLRNHLQDLRPQLPAGITGPSLVDDFWDTYPIIIGISARGLTPRSIRDIAKGLQDELLTLPDVGKVILVGEQQQRVNVDLDLAALSQYQVTPNDIVGAIAAQNALVPSGTVSLGGRLVQVDPSSPLRDLADVANVSVGVTDGRALRVGDVARVTTGYPDPPTELVRVDGRAGVALGVTAKDTSSVTLLGPEVERYLHQAEHEWPAGVNATLLADQPETVNDRISDFAFHLTLAVIIVTGLVAAFMGLRNGILVGITLVLSMTLTFGVMSLLSIDINQISLLALIISLGIVVDAGIVSIDNIEHHLSEGYDRRTAAWKGVQDLWFPLLTSTLVAMSSFIPFRLIGGSIGDYVRDLGVVTSYSLLMSLLVAYFITPILGEWFAVKAENTRGPSLTGLFDRVLDALRAAYVPLARASLHRPVVTVLIAATAVVCAVLYIPHLGLQFFPSADRNQFFIEVNAPEGTDIRTTRAIVVRIEHMLGAEKGVTSYGSFIGAGAPRFYYNVTSEQPKPSYAQMIVQTTDIETANRLVDELGTRVQAIPGARIEVKRLEQGPPIGAPIQLRLTGEDPAAVDVAAARVIALLRSIPNTIDVRDSLGVRTTRLDAVIDKQRATAAGVSPQAVQDLVALAYGGAVATLIREPDRQTPVVVRLPSRLRDDASQFGALAVRNAGGAVVPLAEFATLVPGSETSVANRYDGLAAVTVSAHVEGRLASAVLEDFQRAAAQLQLPPGVSLAYAGESQESEKAFTNLGLAVCVGLLVNQMVLLWEFGTLRLSLVVLCAVPLGLVGAVTGLAVMRQHFGFVAALGISSLGGVVTNHAIVLFEYAKREMESGATMEEALIDAGEKRLRPIFLTIVAAIAGLLPLAFSEQTLWRPLCWAVIFGLSISMLMTLVAIPAIYRLAAGNAPPAWGPKGDEPAAPSQAAQPVGTGAGA